MIPSEVIEGTGKELQNYLNQWPEQRFRLMPLSNGEAIQESETAHVAEWQQASLSSLQAVWDNEDDAVYDQRSNSNTLRIAGLHEGAIETSEDFDAPLPDLFWTGQP